jgi:arylsulfatase
LEPSQRCSSKTATTLPGSADETLDIGEDTGTPVSEDYHVPFRFTGALKKVAIQLTDARLSPEDEEEIRKIKAEIGLSR